jgi:hypothetical protein
MESEEVNVGRRALVVAAVALRLGASTAMSAINIQTPEPFGPAVPCATTDVSDALIALKDAVPDHSTLYAPACATGYHVTKTVDLGTKSVSLVGDTGGAAADGQHLGSVIWGDIAGPLWKVAYPAKDIHIEGVGFVNNHPAGAGVQVGGIGIFLSRLAIHAYIGVFAGYHTFTFALRDSVVHWSGNTPGSVGVMSGGHATIDAVDIVGYDHGLRIWGATVNVSGCRIEVNRVGLAVGLRDDMMTWSLQRSMIAGNSFEANDEAIHVWATTGVTFSGLDIQGTTNSPSHGSQYGIRVQAGAAYATGYRDIFVGGQHSAYAISFVEGHPHNVTFDSVFAQNGGVNGIPVAPSWYFFNPGAEGYTFQNTNYAPPAKPAPLGGKPRP